MSESAHQIGPDLIAGIDPGTHTGLALWSRSNKQLVVVETMGIVTAMYKLNHLWASGMIYSVLFEDARLRRWLGNKGREALQGAGSIKRDCSIWEEFLTGLEGLPFKPVSPKDKGVKVDAERFRKLTGWEGRTTEHSRDAAMLVWGL